jgi:peptidyl-prolyl cis-trans isomerase C
MGFGGRVLREPLIYFLLIGAGVFAVGERFGGDDARHIVVTDSERQRLIDQWQVQMGRPPGDEELEALIEQWIREEIYYREALAAGLDQGDVIIRRRLAQKLAFVSEDTAGVGAPEERALRDWHEANAERYVEPARITFSHHYFSTERREDAQADARAALGNGAAEPAAGDPFMLQRRYVERSQHEIGELFGREFARRLPELPLNEWQGPVRSAYGWHLVNVESRSAPRALPFEEAAARVAADYGRDERQRASEAFYQSIRARYRIIRL